MKEKELKLILQEGEGYKVEFKESFKNIDKDIVAFANSQGGRIFIGITDDKRLKGVKISNKLKSQVYDIARNCDSSIKINVNEFKNILIIEVKEGLDKPYKCSHGFFLRIGPNSQKLTRNEILDFIIKEGKIKFDEQLNTNFDYKKEIDNNKLNKFLKLAGITKTISKKDLLINLGLATRQEGNVYVNNTCVLFFAKDIKKFFRNAYITCALYEGKEKVNVIDRKDFSDGIVDDIENAINFVRKNTRLKYIIKGVRRKEIPEYPLEAIREAIINAVMHRDYFEERTCVFVEIFSNRIEISNPGGLVKGLSKKNFGKRSIPRNPLVADLLHRAKYVEKMGTGINRIKQSMKQHKLKQPKFEFNHFFTITFYGPVKKELISLKTELTGRQREILNFLEKERRITTSRCAHLLKVSNDTALRELSKLKSLKLIQQRGVGRGVYYVIK